MKSKFTHEERKAILDRYILKSESPTSIIEIIKKANVLPNSPLQQKLYVAEKLSSEYSVHMICDALGIARETYYNHVLRNATSKSRKK